MDERETIESALQEVLQGNRDAYRSVVVACEAKVRMVLAAMLPGNIAVDDLTQEVFITAYLKLAEYKQGTDFVAWLKGMARNMALNERQKTINGFAFKEKYRLPFTLIADHDKKVVEAFGVPTTLGFAKRQAFLVKDGRIVWADYSASTKQQAEDVLKVVAAPRP